jgi:hypothetical protein
MTETLTVELSRLQVEQTRALENEVYGCQSASEKARYAARADRISELHRQLHGDDANGTTLPGGNTNHD